MKRWPIPFKDDEMKKRVSSIERLALIGVNASIPLTEACFAIVDKVFSLLNVPYILLSKETEFLSEDKKGAGWK